MISESHIAQCDRAAFVTAIEPVLFGSFVSYRFVQSFTLSFFYYFILFLEQRNFEIIVEERKNMVVH